MAKLGMLDKSSLNTFNLGTNRFQFLLEHEALQQPDSQNALFKV